MVHNGNLIFSVPNPVFWVNTPGVAPEKFGGDKLTPALATVEVFAQKMEFGTKMGFCTFYSLVNSSPQMDDIRMVSLPEDGNILRELP